MKRVLVFFADGFEEIEALTTVDVLRRAGVEVTTVSITGEAVATGAHGVPVVTDSLIEDTELDNADWLVLPGGMPGASNLAAHAELCRALVAQAAAQRGVAAICASPALVLGPLGLLKDKKAICYPGMEDMGLNCKEIVHRHAVVDGNIITGQGPASASAFALAIAEQCVGADAAHDVAKGMLLE